ncbi:SDR family oxidoreductase [Vibrio parahaemolyticus]|nr:SDR family oxidoreductase [Vibrio parahaemolyticus]
MKINVCIFGSSSKISLGLAETLKADAFNVRLYRRDEVDFSNIELSKLVKNLDLNSEYYVFSVGVLYPKNINQQSTDEVFNSISVNLISVVRICEYILSKNKKAKIIIIGSESGKKGSFDTTYFLSKSALKKYVQERHLEHEDQQILLISPSVIEDAGMTVRRSDIDTLEKNKQLHPKKRFLTSKEISGLVRFIIESKFDYLSNCEIEVNGGKFARMKYN